METLRGKLLILIQIFFKIETVTGCGFPPNNTCTCVTHKGKIFADCSSRGLNTETAPDFQLNVVGINFANNSFKEIPQTLPKSLRYLDMSHNYIQSLNESSLIRYRKLRNISVSWNKLLNACIDTFQKLSNLEHLDISNNNMLTIEAISNISYDLKKSQIKTMNFEKLQCTYGVSQNLKIYHVEYLKSTNLLELNLASNRINSLESGLLNTLPKSLRVLNLADNVLGFGLYIMEFAVLHSLEILNLSYQSSFHQVVMVGDFFENCSDTRQSQEIQMRSSAVGKNNDKDIKTEYSFEESTSEFIDNSTNITIYFPPNLRTIYYHDNLYKMSIPKVPMGPINKLTHLYAQRNIIYELIGPLTGIQNVRFIDFSSNFCGYISKHFLEPFTGIEWLNLSNNALGHVFDEDKNGEIFLYQTQIKSLDLSFNRIYRLSDHVFQRNDRMENINLSFNSLNKFTVQIDHMKNLTVLDLSFNQLAFVRSHTIQALNSIAKDKDTYVNLLGNPLKCSCDNLYFVKWLHNSKTKFLMLENYTCEFEQFKEYPLTDIEHLLQRMEKKCSSFTLIIVMLTSLIIISLTTTVSRIVFRYRWKLRYMYYVAKEKYQGHKVEGYDVNQRSYRFDAFISYADQDKEFVVKLVKKIEDEYDLRLCIHHRDFIPGTGIMDNITNAIHCSRRTICIMTSPFLNSYWCMFELNMARMEAIYSRNGGNVLFLIILEKKAMKNMPFYLMDLVKNESYLEYQDGEKSGDCSVFISRLGEILKSNSYNF